MLRDHDGRRPCGCLMSCQELTERERTAIARRPKLAATHCRHWRVGIMCPGGKCLSPQILHLKPLNPDIKLGIRQFRETKLGIEGFVWETFVGISHCVPLSSLQHSGPHDDLHIILNSFLVIPDSLAVAPVIEPHLNEHAAVLL